MSLRFCKSKCRTTGCCRADRAEQLGFRKQSLLAGFALTLSLVCAHRTMYALPAHLYLSDLPMLRAKNGWGPIERDKSNGEQAAGDGRTITLNGSTYAKGLGVH